MIPLSRTDTELCALLRTDPERGLEAIMDAYTNLVYTIVLSKLSAVGTRQDAEECVGDVFIELWHTRCTIDESRGGLRAYLCVLAKRRAIDSYRRLCMRNRHLPTDEVPLDEQTELTADADPVAETLRREAASELVRAVKALGEPDSEIIIRKYYFGETSKAIGRALHMKENTVNKRLSRALAKLKETVKGVQL